MTVSIVQDMGWSISLHIAAEDLVVHSDHLRGIRGDVIVDHCAYLSAEDLAVTQAGRVLREMLEGGTWWLKLSRLRENPLIVGARSCS